MKRTIQLFLALVLFSGIVRGQQDSLQRFFVKAGFQLADMQNDYLIYEEHYKYATFSHAIQPRVELGIRLSKRISLSLAWQKSRRDSYNDSTIEIGGTIAYSDIRKQFSYHSFFLNGNIDIFHLGKMRLSGLIGLGTSSFFYIRSEDRVLHEVMTAKPKPSMSVNGQVGIDLNFQIFKRIELGIGFIYHNDNFEFDESLPTVVPYQYSYNYFSTCASATYSF